VLALGFVFLPNESKYNHNEDQLRQVTIKHLPLLKLLYKDWFHS